jgi:hypothetical protein
MMEKPKQKRGGGAYRLYAALKPLKFSFESPFPIEECASRLKRLNNQKIAVKLGNQAEMIIVSLFRLDKNSYSFEVSVGGQVTGKLQATADGRTLVTGMKVRGNPARGITDWFLSSIIGFLLLIPVLYCMSELDAISRGMTRGFETVCGLICLLGFALFAISRRMRRPPLAPVELIEDALFYLGPYSRSYNPPDDKNA